MTTRAPLYIEGGDDPTRVFQYKDSSGVVVNITGFTTSLVVTVGAVTYTVAGAVDGVNGKCTFTLTDVQTAALKVAGSHGHYKVKILSPSSVDTTIAKGPLSVF